MKLNKYLFNTVNNKELGSLDVVSDLSFGSSAVSLACISSMCSVQCFSWRPFSSFSLWIILLPSDSCCFLAVRSNRLFFFLRCLRLRLVFCAIVFFFVLWGDNVLAGRSSRRLAMVVCLAVSSAISWFESSTTAFLRFFSRDGSTVVLRSLA